MKRLIFGMVLIAMLATPLLVEAAGWEARLGWTTVSGATSYAVQRKVGTGQYADLANPTTNSYNDGPLQSSTAYCYRVAAKNATMQGEFSDEACATIGEPLGKVGGVSITIIWMP